MLRGGAALDPAEQCQLELRSQARRNHDRIFAGARASLGGLARPARGQVEEQQRALG